VVFFGSPADEIIQPWQSSLFGFWDDSQTNIIPMENQPIYTQDWIGLKTLHKMGKLSMMQVPGVLHEQWVTRLDIFLQYLEPLLT